MKGKQYMIVLISLWRSVKEALIHNEHVVLWIKNHQRSISFLKARFDTTLFSGLTLTIFTVTFIYVLALFAGIVEDLITSDTIVAVDIRIANLFVLFRTRFNCHHLLCRVFITLPSSNGVSRHKESSYCFEKYKYFYK